MSGRIGLDQAGALDAADLGRLRPVSCAHIGLCVVHTEGLDLDEHMARFRFGSGTLLDAQHVRVAVLLDDNGAHQNLQVG